MDGVKGQGHMQTLLNILVREHVLIKEYKQ